MSQRYTAVFEWTGEPPAVSALNGWLGGRLVRLTLDDERTEESAGPREFHEVVIDGRTYRTTSQKLVGEIQGQALEIQEMGGRLIAAHRTLQNVRAQLATSQRNETVGRMSRAGLSEDDAVEVIRAIHLNSPKGYSAHDTVQLVRNIVEAADEVRVSRIRKLAAVSSVPLSNPFEAMAERADAQAALEEEHRYLSSALLSRCGPRAIGETWVDYARRTMGAEGGR